MPKRPLRSHGWFFDNEYYAFARRSYLRSEGFNRDIFEDKPVIGICNSWSELNHCNRHLREVAEAVKRGVWKAGGVPLEFPTISLGEPFIKPTAMLLRNLMAMDVEECIRGQSAGRRSAALRLRQDDTGATDGRRQRGPAVDHGSRRSAAERLWKGTPLGSGTDGRKLYDEYRMGQITEEEWCEIEGAMARSAGHCMVMGTASTMTILAEALGMTLPDCANIPAADSRRLAIAELSGEARRRDGRPRTSRPSRDHDAGSLRERDRRLHGAGRIDQRRRSSHRHGRPPRHPPPAR